ncbi:alpha/beta fold hydrolase [Hyphococcus lacteus]|uniref:Alpha/beta fold hydrolase n=1 Tax=Hyphococcus lacteus TaxID=3143536 RepID=A0ABV3Z301_9PROT
MSERVVQFGEGNRLHGILNQVGGNGPNIILFNAGIVHRIGAHRLNVKIARHLASHGFSSLRFDLSGLGDSAAAPAGRGFEEQAVMDITQAMDCVISEIGGDQFVAIGMCSGADNSYRAALSDPRIKGIILLDPYAYDNSAAAFESMISRVTDVDRWARKAKKMAGLEKPKAVPATADDDDQARPIPPLEEFGADLEKLCDGGTKIYIIYTGFVKNQITRASQFFSTFKSFDFKHAISVDVFPEFDHTYTELAGQDKLLSCLSGWFNEKFPVASKDQGT